MKYVVHNYFVGIIPLSSVFDSRSSGISYFFRVVHIEYE